jgi:hypothetical protein
MAYLASPACAFSAPVVREVGPASAPKARLLDRVREAIRTRHYSRRTEKGPRRVDPPVHSLPWQAAPARDGWTPGDAVLDVAGRREPCRRFHPEPGAQCAALPLPRGARAGVALARRHRSCQADRPPARGADPRRSPRRHPSAPRRSPADGDLAPRSWPSSPRGRARAGQGYRFRASPDHGARGKGRQGSGHAAARGHDRQTWPSIWKSSSVSTTLTCDTARDGSSCRGRWPASIPTRRAGARTRGGGGGGVDRFSGQHRPRVGLAMGVPRHTHLR